MTLISNKESIPAVYPRTLWSIVASVGGLALFLIFACTLLVSQPMGDTVRGYFYGVDISGSIDLAASVTNPDFESDHTVNNTFDNGGKSYLTVFESGHTVNNKFDDGRKSNSTVFKSNHTFNTFDREPLAAKAQLSKSRHENEPLDPKSEEFAISQEDGVNASSSLVNAAVRENAPSYSAFANSSASVTDLHRGGRVDSAIANSSSSITDLHRGGVVDSGCDLYHGNWVYDPTGPLYTNSSCPVITQMQNCQGNGRPDKDYENWRWKPSQCDLPRFDPKKFLELMRGKTIAFIGDSIARNQMESMLCLLWQVEVPKNRGSKAMQRQYFKSTGTSIVRIWSSWLVHQTSESFDYAPAGVTKIHLDTPDEFFMKHIMGFDVIVLSSGHWFAKQSVYILNNEIVGGQLWWPDKSKKQKINNIEAFGISVEAVLTALGTHPNYTGLTIVRSFSPDHYEGGGWNTGGSCTGKVRPVSGAEVVENGFTNIMHEKQAKGFDQAIKRKTNRSKLKFMDITKAFTYRVDGHPGPFRNLDPNKKIARGRNGQPPPQDCLHWCMPGPVDTWNEMVFEIIRGVYDGQNKN